MFNNETGNQPMEQPKKEVKKTMTGFREFKKSLLNADGKLNNDNLNQKRQELESWKHWINEEYKKAKKSEEKAHEEKQKANARYEKALTNLELLENAKLFLEK